MDGGPNHLTAMALARYLEREMYQHVDDINAIVREKRDAMLSALGEYFPPTCKWTKPKGGLFIWLELPEGMDAEKLRDKAFEAGVGFAPGVWFSPGGKHRNCLRLCFGYMSPEDTKEGVRILAEVFEREGVFGKQG
jgi:2-aminoadipate transaminase